MNFFYLVEKKFEVRASPGAPISTELHALQTLYALQGTLVPMIRDVDSHRG